MATKTAISKTMDFRRAFTDLNANFAMNEITRQVEINGNLFERYRESEFMCRMREKGALKENVILREIDYAAYENRYHPIKRYLNSLAYDGKDYIGKLCSFFQSDQYFEIWLRRWLIMAIARVVNNAQCPVLILDGPQNCGKSKFVQWLCSSPMVKEYFTEGQINPDSKDTRIRATQKWIWEVPEFGATARKADVEMLKGFITLGEVTERAAYQKTDEKRPMLACFIGTINNGNAGFLSDPSGNRRFLITHIESIDWRGYTEELSPEDVWGQAYSDYLIGEPFELTDYERQLSAQNNERYQAQDPLLAILENLYDFTGSNSDFVPTSELIQELQASGFKAGNTNSLSKQISNTLIGLGLTKERRRSPIFNVKNPVMGFTGLRKIP